MPRAARRGVRPRPHSPLKAPFPVCPGTGQSTDSHIAQPNSWIDATGETRTGEARTRKQVSGRQYVGRRFEIKYAADPALRPVLDPSTAPLVAISQAAI